MKIKLKDASIEGVRPEVLALVEKHVERKMDVEAAIRTELQALRPNFQTSDAEKARRHEDAFVESLAARYEFSVDESTGKVTMYQDGSRVTNGQGYAVGLPEIVREAAQSMYTLFSKESGAPSSAPGTKFKDQQDYLNRYFGAKSTEERSRLVEAWRQQTA